MTSAASRRSGSLRGQPGQLGRHRAGVERDAGAGPVDVVAPHALGQRRAPRPRRGGRTTGCPCRSGRPARSPGRRSAGRPSRRPRRPRRRRAGAWARASAQAMTSDVHQRSGSCSVQPTCGWVVVSSERASATRPSSPQRPTLVTVVPKSMVRITGRAPARATRPAVSAGVGVLVERAAHGHAGASAFHDVAHLVEHAVARRPSVSGPPRKRTGTPTLATTRATARWRSAPGRAAGTGTLITGAPMSWAMIGASTMASVSRRIRPSSHSSGSISASSPASLDCSSTWPSSSSAEAVSGSSMSMRVMCLTPVQPSAAARRHAGDQAVVELEDGAGQTRCG